MASGIDESSTQHPDLPAPILEALSAHGKDARVAAVQQVAELAAGTDAALATLARNKLANLTEDDSISVSTAAREALAALPPPPQTELPQAITDALESPILDVRVAGVRALADLHKQEGPLKETASRKLAELKSDDSRQVAQEASKALNGTPPEADDTNDKKTTEAGISGETLSLVVTLVLTVLVVKVLKSTTGESDGAAELASVLSGTALISVGKVQKGVGKVLHRFGVGPFKGQKEAGAGPSDLQRILVAALMVAGAAQLASFLLAIVLQGSIASAILSSLVATPIAIFFITRRIKGKVGLPDPQTAFGIGVGGRAIGILIDFTFLSEELLFQIVGRPRTLGTLFLMLFHPGSLLASGLWFGAAMAGLSRARKRSGKQQPAS